MREIRTSGSEGGEPQANEASLPLSQRQEVRVRRLDEVRATSCGCAAPV